MIKIKGLQKTSLIDYPDKICCVVFLPRCNFRCPFCYNIDLISNYEKLPDIKEEEFFEFLKSKKQWLDGVCVTGGEPTLHKELPDFLAKIKKLGFLVKLDTNGTNPGMVKDLIEKKLVDFIAMDIKAPLERYQEVVKVDVDKEKIKESVELIKNSDIDYEFRTTVVPDLYDEKDALAIAHWLKGAKKYCIQQFRSERTLDPAIKNQKPYKEEELQRFLELVKPYLKRVEIRGV